jgi:hypothetical protein
MGVLRLVGGMPLAVLLPLLGAVLLGEIGDTVPNPMCSFGQSVLTAFHLGLDLLAERPIGGGGYGTAAYGGGRYKRRDDRCGGFAFDRCRKYGCESGWHSYPRFITYPAHEGRHCERVSVPMTWL